ncbi:hypothetical protein QTI17_31310 [Variovorax sp. J31P179]|uniref:hypothetical protein n=1 Tax=Variovorax sp. J31P179 TaxID=3053508 RepID=UPI002578FF3D|nr:hypothetical protein [Variovorax sp. J31P179]MDM0085084.1 hypothetical protein [Variovorax sp. J31P179]
MNTGNPGFQTEIEFELPRGYVDNAGTLHRRGVMRLATAADEILPLRDPRVTQNEAYLTVIVLSRVIVRLGSLADIHTGVIEGLFAGDLAYLQRLYEHFNGDEETAQGSPKPAVNGGGPALRRMTALGEV